MGTKSIEAHFVEDVLQTFRDYKKLAERAFEQLDDPDLFRTLDQESNSVAVNMKHMAGNMLSRWSDFLTSDGEKPGRNRDMEFVMLPETSRADIIAYWEQGWACTFNAIEPLNASDLMRTVTIRGQDHTIVQAINRQLAHYAYHVGQIVFLAKHFKAGDWKNLSVPKNQSAEFNQYLEERTKQHGDTPRGDRLNEVMNFAAKKG